MTGCGGGGASNAGGALSTGHQPAQPGDTAFDTQLAAFRQQTQQLGGSVEVKVNLAKSSITDESLRTLPLPENLSSLDLSSTKITDAGLAHVKKARRLKELFLVDVSITDAGLVHLREMPELENVDLRHSKVSQSAQWALMKELRQRAYDRQQALR